VIASTNTEPRVPPTIEIVARSRNEIDGWPKAAADSRASAATYSDDPSVRANPRITLRRRIPPGRHDTSNRPAAMLVPRRAAVEPEITPRIPTAAGIRTNRPGRSSSVPVSAASGSPATNPANVLSVSATMP
jgi:hypothetical protein